MITASLAVLALGFVVAVAADSLPGDSGAEPLLDLSLRANIDLSPILAWMLMILAVVGAVLLAVGLKEGEPREDRKRRSILGALIGLIAFVVIFRWVRPAAEALLEGGSAVAESATDTLAEGRAGTASGWLFSILLAAILAAALTRIGLAIRDVPSPFSQPEVAGEVPVRGSPVAVVPLLHSLGDDPRSRILNAYQEFESGLAAVGQPRVESETTGHHARRVARELSLDADAVRDLVERHASARYGSDELSESAAEAAERSSLTLRKRMKE